MPGGEVPEERAALGVQHGVGAEDGVGGGAVQRAHGHHAARVGHTAYWRQYLRKFIIDINKNLQLNTSAAEATSLVH